MNCPTCLEENIAGADVCNNCGHDLTDLSTPIASSPEEQRIMTEPLAQIGAHTPVFVAPDTSLRDTVRAMCENNIGCVLVGAPDNLLGIFSERDLLLRAADRHTDLAGRPIRELMTPKVETLKDDAPIAYALNRMAVGNYRHVPITHAGRVVGIVSARDMMQLISGWYPEIHD